MCLLMFGQMGFLSEAFSTKLARKWFLPRMCPHVYVDTVFVFEPFVTNVTIMQKTGFFLGFLLVRSSLVLSHLGQVGQLGSSGSLAVGVTGGRRLFVEDEVAGHVHLDGDDAGGTGVGGVDGGVAGGGGGAAGLGDQVRGHSGVGKQLTSSVLQPGHGLSALQG